MLSWHIARENYVVSRFCLKQGLTYSGCLLAEQSVEMYIKAIYHLYNKCKDIHYLPKLLENGKEKVPYFNKLLNDPKLAYFIKNLWLVYKHTRFGETGFKIEADEVIQVLDEVVYNLDRSYQEIVSPTDKEISPLYVPNSMKTEFLRNNRYYSEKDISNNIMASMPMP
jgi:HEPN domain-containing protein